jgi:hypothetical protein
MQERSGLALAVRGCDRRSGAQMRIITYSGDPHLILTLVVLLEWHRPPDRRPKPLCLYPPIRASRNRKALYLCDATPSQPWIAEAITMGQPHVRDVPHRAEASPLHTVPFAISMASFSRRGMGMALTTGPKISARCGDPHYRASTPANTVGFHEISPCCFSPSEQSALAPCHDLSASYPACPSSM